MQYYCYYCDLVYGHGSKTVIKGHGKQTRHLCPNCGQEVRSCASMVRLKLKPLPPVETCSKCHWRFRCWTGEWFQ
jgi:hypothetical protein